MAATTPEVVNNAVDIGPIPGLQGGITNPALQPQPVPAKNDPELFQQETNNSILNAIGTKPVSSPPPITGNQFVAQTNTNVLAALGAGGVISAIGAFLGGDPIAKIERLAAAGDGLQNAATGLQAMAGALTQVAAALASIDVSKLNALDNFASNRSTESVVGGITSFLTAPIKAIGSMVEGAGGGNDNAEMVKAINEVRDAVNKLYAKDTSIHMDGKKVGTTLTQGSHKVA
jgi:hypothetical protein